MKKTIVGQSGKYHFVEMRLILTAFLVSVIVTPAKASRALDQVEMPLLTQINFNTYTPTAFGNQDVNPTMTIEDGGNTLHLKGNSWKKISIPYTITSYTVLEFDFKSTAQGEVQGIGFDNDETITEGYTHKLYGTQSWGIDVPYYRYANSAPSWRHYRILIGEYYTGNMLYLVFVNDHDVSNPTGESYFSNVEVFEDASASAQPPVDVDFDDYTISPYDGYSQSPNLTLTLEDSGDTLHMLGNGWLKMSLLYTVTASTVIEFDFLSGLQGEIHAIGFDSDSLQQANYTFQLYGSQSWGINAFTYTGYAPGWKHYRIPVGKYYTGVMKYIFFANDHDISNPTAESFYRNLIVYEGEVSLPVTIDFNQYALSPYYSLLGSNAPGISIEDNGNTLHLTSNGWTQLSMPIPILINTILAFDFKSTVQGEIHALGFDTDQNTDPGLTFKLYGTQDYGFTNFNDYSASAPNWKHYEIPVGQYYTGMQLYLFFANDQDVPSLTVESYFSNVVIFSQPPTAVPTITNTPTYTPTVTATSTYTPTATFTPTATTTFTLTPTFTPTITPTPNRSGSGTCWASGASWPNYYANYTIDTNTIPTGWQNSIDSAANTWTNVTPSHFIFSNLAGTDNLISKGTLADPDQLALTSIYATSTTPITKVVTVFSDTKSFDTSNPPASGNYSLENVMVHEFGHWLYLVDIYDLQNCGEVTMYGYVAIGETKKISLESADQIAINWQYP